MEKRTRNTRVNLRLTQEEKDFLIQRKEEAGFPVMTDFLLRCAEDSPIFNIDTRPFYHVADALNRIETNINQIANITEKSNSAYKSEITEIQKTIKELAEITHKCMGVFIDARDGKMHALKEIIEEKCDMI